MSGRKIAGILLLLFALLLVSGFIAISVWAYSNRRAEHQSSNSGACISGDITTPESVSCYTIGGYNAYPTAEIATNMSKDVSFGSITVKSGVECYEKCDTTSGCVCTECTGAAGGDSFTCVGYNTLPKALKPDSSDGCTKNNVCGTVFIKSSAV